jgi:hypothetical protein
MRIFIKLLLPLCAVVLFTMSANAQAHAKEKDRGNRSGPAVIIVKSAAQAAWTTTKFVAKDIAKPVAKAVLVKAVPKVTVYMLKKSPVIGKRVLPIALRLAVF